MFTPEFDRLHDEAFLSATGIGFHEPLVQEFSAAFTAKTVDALLDHWTRPEDTDEEAVTELFATRRAHLLRLRHPMTAEFTEEDAAAIAKVRFFGRACIVAAKAAIGDNPAGLDVAVEFGYGAWHRAHPDNDAAVNDPGHDPDAPSPRRLYDWPKGRYVNCLGISIGLAALSEMNPEVTDYRYMNRIRHAQLDTNVAQLRMRERIHAVSPHAIYYEQISHLAEVLRTANTEQPVCLYEKGAPAFLLNVRVDKAFHHAVIRKSESADFLTTGWRQQDPYALVDSELNNFPLAVQTAKRISEIHDGTCNEVLLHDSDFIDEIFKGINGSVNVALKIRPRLEAALQDYKSPDYLTRLREELALQDGATFGAGLASRDIGDVSVDELVNGPMTFRMDPTEPQLAYEWFTLLSSVIINDDVRDNKVMEPLIVSIEEGRNKDIEAAIGIVTGLIMKKIRHDLPLRQELEETVRAMPFVYCLKRMESMVRSLSTGGGTSDQTMEIGDPAFMIGAMYLNHYARWRKGDKINVAKELARLTPSQLIWQSAVVRDKDATRDPRIRAVGELVKGLKIDQQHPLVRITVP